MKIKKKVLIGVLAILIACIILQPNKSNAALQSNGGAPVTRNVDNWMLQIRQMQELGGTLGRTDTIDTTNLTSNATDLDIHMEKNTEYGAMAILSASAYGNPNPIEDGETTTGNSTGIVINLNKEWVAAGTISNSTIYTGANERYKNIYTTVYSPKNGDTITETQGWHGSSSSVWFNSNLNGGLLRAYGGSLFSYYAASSNRGDAPYTASYYSRAVIVVGTGI